MTDNTAIIQATSHKPQATNNFQLVSIIIPAYNTAPYIYRAIESSLRQTHPNVEVLVIDDGSTDETSSVARSYEPLDKRVRVFTQANSGVSVARNHGIREAQGDYLIFLDSDDWLEDNAVEVMLKAQTSNPDKLIACNAYKVSYAEKGKDRFCKCTAYPPSSNTFTVAETIYSWHICKFPETSCAKLFRTDIVQRYNLSFREGIHYGEDQLFALEYLFKMQGSFYTSEPLFNILQRPGSAMRTPYKLQKKNKEDWVEVVLSHEQELSPDVSRAVEVFAGGRYKGRLPAMLRGGEDKTNILLLRAKTKPFAVKFLTSREVPIKSKLSFIISVYLPVPIARSISLLWNVIKRILTVDKR